MATYSKELRYGNNRVVYGAVDTNSAGNNNRDLRLLDVSGHIYGIGIKYHASAPVGTTVTFTYINPAGDEFVVLTVTGNTSYFKIPVISEDSTGNDFAPLLLVGSLKVAVSGVGSALVDAITFTVMTSDT